MLPLFEPQDAGLLKVVLITGTGLMVTVIIFLGPSQPAGEFVWLTQ